MQDDEVRSEATTIRFNAHNINELGDHLLSPPCYIGNLPWKIMVMPRQALSRNRQQLRFLGFFLQCNGESESASWSCYAKAELRLISHKPDTEPFVRRIQHLFYSKENDWGFAHFISWSDLLNPEKGYVKDNTITLEVQVSIDEMLNGGVDGELEACVSKKKRLDDEDKDARSEATFRFIAPNIKELKDFEQSPPCYIRNLPWKIMVMPRRALTPNRQQLRSLGFFLQCNTESESASWSCYATAELRLISHKPDTEPFVRRIQHLFHSKENDWGFAHFISWSDLLNPEKGYVKDNAITLEVHVTADEPHGIPWAPRNHTDAVDKATEETLRASCNSTRTRTRGLVFIGVAGRSSGLGLVLSGNTWYPVINCQPPSETLVQDIWRSGLGGATDNAAS